jgi:hypothetical protein
VPEKTKGRRLPSWRVAALVGAAVLIAVIVVAYRGIGYASAGDRIDVPALQQELSRVLHEQLLGQGFDYEPSVACLATDASHYNCAITIRTPEGKTIADNISVTCGAPSVATGHRCFTQTGFALQ